MLFFSRKRYRKIFWTPQFPGNQHFIFFRQSVDINIGTFRFRIQKKFKPQVIESRFHELEKDNLWLQPFI